MRRTPSLLLATFVVCSTVAPASEPREAIPADLVLQRFPVAKGGAPLLVPVRFGGKDHLFVVDTGCTNSVFDPSLPLGAVRESVKASTPDGEITVNLYDPPVASVGVLPFRVANKVASFDLKKFSEADGRPVKGILGMDFLGQYVVHVDFDKGELLFLKSAPTDHREVVPMFWTAENVPEVECFLTGEEKIRFRIGTGQSGVCSGALQTQLMARLVAKDKFRKVASSSKTTASGISDSTEFQGRFLALGGFGVERPVFNEILMFNQLGLGFWSRFAVTFDFPGRKVLLSKGEGYGRPDRWALSGLHLEQQGGVVVIVRVDKGSAGEAAGVKPGDVFLRLNDLRAGEASLYEIGAALSEAGKFTIQLRRGARKHELTMIIKR